MFVRRIVFTVMIASCSLASAGESKCFREASIRYGIPEEVLRAISHVESRGNPRALNKNRNGSADIGHMQINSSWLPKLAKYGINKENLMNPCINTHVGAWILAQNVARLGYNWKAIGAYNSRDPRQAEKYIKKVAVALQKQAYKKR